MWHKKLGVLDEEVENQSAFIAMIIVGLQLLEVVVDGRRKWIFLGEFMIQHPPVVL